MFFEWKSRIRHYLAFSRKEVQDMAIVIAVAGFIFSFRDWVDPLIGVRNLILAIVIVGFSFLARQAFLRAMGLNWGIKIDFKLWWGGLAASLLLVFLSKGIVQIILPGGMIFSLLIRHRIGEFRYGLNYLDTGTIAIFGPLANLLLAFAAKIMTYAFPGWFFEKMLFVNIVFAICTVLPIPPLDGVNIFFGSRQMFVMALAGITATALLLFFTGILFALTGGLIFMLAGILYYYLIFENKLK